MSKFNELNEIFCGNLKNFFELEDKYFNTAKKIKDDYCNYMEIIDNVRFWTLDYNLNVIEEANNDFYSKYSSPMKEGDDGFWYFAFLLHF